ncbi:hypothetical protein FGO68_gene2075 [Halteria grandinella]|uniref:Uncharacterized protein n=1 Tax=Halteria grandinella TaxID=5974 RepID=A0A8J8NXP7_HALGN|nr:hypothetical protein FGO68_gene2075 [Halteria grandinella]
MASNIGVIQTATAILAQPTEIAATMKLEIITQGRNKLENEPVLTFTEVEDQYLVISKIQRAFDLFFETLKPKQLQQLADFLDCLEEKFDDADKKRNPAIFPDPLRERLMDSWINQYVIRFTGEIGNKLSEQELAKANLQIRTILPLEKEIENEFQLFKFRNRNLHEWTKYNSFEDFFKDYYKLTLEGGPKIVIDSQERLSLPLVLKFQAFSEQECKYVFQPGSMRKRNQSELTKTLSTYHDFVSALEEILSTRDLTILELQNYIREDILPVPSAAKKQKTPKHKSILELVVNQVNTPRGLHVKILKLNGIKTLKKLSCDERICCDKRKDAIDLVSVCILLENISQSKPSLEYLRRIDFSDIPITLSVMQAISEVLKGNQLTELCISNIIIYKEDQIIEDPIYIRDLRLYSSLVEGLKENTSLRVLELANCYLDDEIGEEILGALEANANKRINFIKINLAKNELGEESAKLLLKLMRVCPFESIDIRENCIINNAMEDLIIQTRFTSTLQEMRIDGNQAKYQREKDCLYYLCCISCFCFFENNCKKWYNPVFNAIPKKYIQDTITRIAERKQNLQCQTAKFNVSKLRKGMKMDKELKHQMWLKVVEEENRRKKLEEDREHQKRLEIAEKRANKNTIQISQANSVSDSNNTQIKAIQGPPPTLAIAPVVLSADVTMDGGAESKLEGLLQSSAEQKKVADELD